MMTSKSKILKNITNHQIGKQLLFTICSPNIYLSFFREFFPEYTFSNEDTFCRPFRHLYRVSEQ